MTLEGAVLKHQFLMGSESFGRDIYSRVIYGTQVSLLVGLLTALASLALGIVFGLLSGYIRWVDSVVMRVMDGLMAIPSILIAIALVLTFKILKLLNQLKGWQLSRSGKNLLIPPIMLLGLILLMVLASGLIVLLSLCSDVMPTRLNKLLNISHKWIPELMEICSYLLLLSIIMLYLLWKMPI